MKRKVSGSNTKEGASRSAVIKIASALDMKGEQSRSDTKGNMSRTDMIRNVSQVDMKKEPSGTETNRDASRSNVLRSTSQMGSRVVLSRSDDKRHESPKRRKSRDSRKSIDTVTSQTRTSISGKKRRSIASEGTHASTTVRRRRVRSRPSVTEDDDEYSYDDEEDDESKVKSTLSKTKQHLRKREKREKVDKDDEGVQSKVFTIKSSLTGIKKKKKGKKSRETISSEHDMKSWDSREEFIALELARIQALTKGALAPDAHSQKSRGTEHSMTHSEEPQEKKEKIKKSKKVKGKKLMKKSMTTLLMEQEAEKQRIAEEEKIQAELERLRCIEKQKREISEQQQRMEQLAKSVKAIQGIIDYNNELAEIEKKQLEWQIYIACGKLPNPSLCYQMTTYLHLWSQSMKNTTVKMASERTYDVMTLLADLEDLIDNVEDEDSHAIENYKWIYNLLKEFQNVSLTIATYKLLKYIEKNMHRVDLPTADFNFEDDFMNMNVWLRMDLPIPLPNPRRPPKPRIDLTFPRLNVRLIFPPDMDGRNMAVRLLYLKYDHLSEKCDSYDLKSTFDHENLLEATRYEWRTKQKYKYIQSLSGKTAEELEEIHFRDDEEIPIVPFKMLDPSASSYYLNREYESFFDEIKHYLIYSPSNVLNLRKYSIVGGLYQLDLVYKPPQPLEQVAIDLNVACFYLPKELIHVPFYGEYAPTPSASKISVQASASRTTPQASASRTITQASASKTITQVSASKTEINELDSLLQVQIALPKQVVFPELPILCLWDPDEDQWSTYHIHEVEYDETNGVVRFKTEVFGIFAFASLRCIHLPYQNWRIMPDKDDSVTVRIVTSFLRMDFNIKGRLICLSLLQNCSGEVLKDVVGKYMKLNRLRRHLRSAGIDIFPEADGFCYVDNMSEKHAPMARHLCFQIAQLSNCFKFAWSKWNANGGRRKVILRMKEFCPAIGKVTSTYSTLLVTPLKAAYINCTETCPIFSDEEVEDIKFSADLYNLMKVTNGIAIRKRVVTAKRDTILTLAEFIINIRLLSFS